MNEVTKQNSNAKPVRRDRLVRELDHDPYHSKLKIKGPAVCPDCHAVYCEGRWTWKTAPTDAADHVCPACQRIRDRVPAAFLTLSGDFLADHGEEIMNLIHNHAQQQRAEHPLKRIIGYEEREGALAFTLTDAHLARGLGEALQQAYGGEIDYQYTKEDIMLRVSWSR
jgi:hypothetical protein